MRSITDIVKSHLEKNDRPISWLAEQLKEVRSNTHRKLSAKSLDTDYLVKISEVTKHDFFADFSAELRKKWKDIEVTAVAESESEWKKMVTYAEYQAVIQENLELYRKLERCREELATK